MDNLIKITNTVFNGENIQAVNARDLWRELESKQEFANWIKNRIKDSQAIEGQDFIVFDKNIKNPLGGRPEKEYIVSLDMAKHFCMLERNEKGRQIRQYFIDVEKEVRKMANNSIVDMSLEGFKRNAENAQRLYEIYKEQLELKHAQQITAEKQEKLEIEQNKLKDSQETTNKKIDNLTAKAEAALEGIEYYSVASYARVTGYVISNMAEARKIGKECVRQSKLIGIPLGRKVPQGNKGMRVNTYHLKVIKKVFDELEQDDYSLFDDIEERDFFMNN